MLTPAFVNTLTFFYPIGNTPAVSLTQSLPPDASADILLLGCGDVRNMLFTSHIDGREMDITCCDNQKAVIARNILLLSLIIDRKDGKKDSSLWSIYYHMHIDKKSLDLLRSQAKKLYELSASMDTWQQSKYGSSLALCDSATLADLKKMWGFYSMEQDGEGLLQLNRRFESVLNDAKAIRSAKGGGRDILTGFQSAVPVHYDAYEDLNALYHHYWKHGSTELDADIRATEQHPNPTFVTLEHEAILHYATNPLLGFHLVTAYAPLHPNNPVFERTKNLPHLERLVMVARMEFREWLSSYRRHHANMRIRFLVGDAISFAHTLQNKRVTTSSTANWYRDRYSFQRLELDGIDYRLSVAPLDFDVIDTSNLCDHVGSLVLLTACSPLLRNHAAAVLYTEVMARGRQRDSEVISHMLCGHVPTLSVLLDLFPVEYWTNISSVSSAEHGRLSAIANAIPDRENKAGPRQTYLRLCWKRPISINSHPGPTKIRFDARQLAKVLYEVYAYMFRDEDYAYKISLEYIVNALLSSLVWYHRGSFVSFLRLVQSRVTCDWDEAMDRLLDLIENRDNAPMGMQYYQELCAHLHLMGSYSTDVLKFWHERHESSILSDLMRLMSLSRIAPVGEKSGDLGDWEDIPAVVCVTLKIPRKKLAVFTEAKREELSTPYVHCLLEGSHSQGENSWQNIFAACQLAFGDISTRGKPYDNSFEVSIVEDDAGWNGTSPLIAMFYAPAFWLLREPQDAIIAFGVHSTPLSTHHFTRKLGLEMKVYETTFKDSASVYITRYGPNQTQFPVATGISPASLAKPTNLEADMSMAASVDEANGHISSFTGRLDITGDNHKQALQDECKVQKSTISPREVLIRLSDAAPLSLSFPGNVVESSQRVRIARKSCYIEVIAKVATAPQWVDYPDYMCPVVLRHGKLTNWNMTYVNLATCPIIDVDQPQHELNWLRAHLNLMISTRERGTGIQTETSRSAGEELLLKFKETLMLIFLRFASIGTEGRHTIFCLKTGANGAIRILILVNSLRINLADRAALLDCAILPLLNDPASNLEGLAEPLLSQDVFTITVHDAEMWLWRHVLAAYVERCRTWTHRGSCEYVRSGAVPPPSENGEQFLCTCGNGELPRNFVKDIANCKTLIKRRANQEIEDTLTTSVSDTIYPLMQDVLGDQPSSTITISPDMDEKVARTRRSLRTRLGPFVITINLLTIIGLFISLGSISWIWFGRETIDDWRRLVLTNRLDIIVTTISVFIRLAIATQATTVISMLASLALEEDSHGGVELRKIPAMSIARYSNTGPLSVLLLFWKGLRPGLNCLFVATLIITYTSIVAQFTSTLLLRDLYIGEIIDFPQSKSSPVGFGLDTWINNNMSVLVNQGRNYWTSPPVSFPSFAQWSEDPTIEMDSVMDTGPSLRAFLPIASPDTRASLIDYEGIADVFDTRVFCSRPTVHINDTGEFGQYLSGTLVHGNITDEIAQILKLPENRTTTFSVNTNTFRPGSFLFKQLDITQGGLISVLDPTINSTLQDHISVHYEKWNWVAQGLVSKPRFSTSKWKVELGHAFLFISSQSISSVLAGQRNPGIRPSLVGYRPLENGVWLEYPAGFFTSGYEWGVNITVCYDALFTPGNKNRVKHHESFPIRATRASNASEPLVTWGGAIASFNTTAISGRYSQSPQGHHSNYLFHLDREPVDRHLGALQSSWWPSSLVALTPSSVFSVGFEFMLWFFNITLGLDITHNENPGSPQYQELFKTELFDFVYDIVWRPFSNRNFELAALCPQCPNHDVSIANNLPTPPYLHPLLSSIVNDIFGATGQNPAATWQALMTLVLSSAYYDLLPAFSRNDTITTTNIVQRLQPGDRVGYTIVVATVLLQLVISVLVLFRFWKRTHYSFLGNAWQALSQIVSADTMPLLLRSTMVTDNECQILEDDFGAGESDEKRDSRLILREHADGRVVLQC
ncbi:hypothetical protein O1611_g3175 [Lasiodiplodia mahajangana]|uniref:Uncharacterized protein n=1 Tax=Lasiodiplodia mahajangana TaxID=1108764 RepID=A0ACC2JSS8_9PEZI|nr:hypothetical protein O1611_g3175 [Lasiodiplodia mahajangana]